MSTSASFRVEGRQHPRSIVRTVPRRIVVKIPERFCPFPVRRRGLLNAGESARTRGLSESNPFASILGSRNREGRVGAHVSGALQALEDTASRCARRRISSGILRDVLVTARNHATEERRDVLFRQEQSTVEPVPTHRRVPAGQSPSAAPLSWKLSRLASSSRR